MIDVLQECINGSIDGFTYISVEDLEEIKNYIIKLKEENREIRATHYHESIVKNLMKNKEMNDNEYLG